MTTSEVQAVASKGGLPGRLGRLLGDRRFNETLAAFEKEYRSRAERLPGKWTEAIPPLLEAARAKAAEGDFDSAWSCLLAAIRTEILDYRPYEVPGPSGPPSVSRQRRSCRAGGPRLSWSSLPGRKKSWLPSSAPCSATRPTALPSRANSPRSRTEQVRARELLNRLLPKDQSETSPARVELLLAIAQKRARADRHSLWLATQIRDEDFRNHYRRLRILRNQLALIGVVLALALVALVFLVAFAPVSVSEAHDSVGGRIWGWVLLFGVLGGAVSAAQSISSRAASTRIPVQIQRGLLTAVRPLFGAAGAAAVYVLLSPTVDSVGAVLGLAFAAGFSERIVVQAVGSVLGGSGGAA